MKTLIVAVALATAVASTAYARQGTKAASAGSKAAYAQQDTRAKPSTSPSARCRIPNEVWDTRGYGHEGSCSTRGAQPMR